MPLDSSVLHNRPVDWRRNILWLWIINALTQFGVYSAQPFIPLYIRTELGVHDPRSVAYWVGLAGSAVGISLVLTGPAWGRLGDRFGRKTMALRATGLGGIFVASVAVVQTPIQLVAVRFFTGAVAGNQSAITALVGSETPAAEVGRALGLIGAATAIGRATGPLLGGLLLTAIGLRYQFAIAGFLMTAAAIPLAMLVRETDRRHDISRQMSLRELLRSAPASSLRLAGLLLAVQAITVGVNFTTVQFLGLKILETVPAEPAFFTGLAFSVAGVCTAIGALGYSRVVAAVGYHHVSSGAVILFGVGVGAVALGRSPDEIVIAAGGMGLAFGACLPAINSMIGLESPEPLRGTVFGAGASLAGLTIAIVPAMAGVAAAATNVSTALASVAIGATGCGAALLLFGREPNLPAI